MRFLILLPLFISLSATAQWKKFIIGVKGDTLNRVDQKDMKQGPWVIHVDELRGEPGYDEQGYYVDNEKDGVWVRFSLSGDKIAAETYRWGALHGKAMYWNRTGGLLREESWRAVDPEKTMDTVAVYDAYDINKIVDTVVVKLTNRTYKHGTWKYYDPEWGTVLKTEEYFLDKIKTDGDVADDMKPIDPAKKTVAKPKAVLDYEKKNSGKKKIKTRDGSTGVR
jgi:hypothetical protein